MRVVVDIEANGLINPTKIWVIVCKDIDYVPGGNTEQYHIFRKVSDDENEKQNFLVFSRMVSLWIGHNLLDYDLNVLLSLLDLPLPPLDSIVDTLVFSKLKNYSRDGHSIEDYGLEFGIEKDNFNDFSKYSIELENRCVRDVDINHKIYSLYEREILSKRWERAFRCEQQFQLIASDISRNGFAFNSNKATLLLAKVTKELDELDKHILEVFPPHLKPIREVHPVLTKFGTLNRKDFRFDGADLSEYNGGPFTRCTWEVFNPGSHKQVIDVLHNAGWRPIDKTNTHIDLLRQSKRRNDYPDIDFEKRLDSLSKYGYKINETNLGTLPVGAPAPARTLAKRILLEARRRTLTEWLDLVGEDERIHGKFIAIGAWTHRMAHQKPNMANIPNSHNINGTVKLLGGEMRSLFIAPKGRLLVGIDAESIQLRIFAHYIDDKEFTDAIVQGKKSEKTDPHSLNQRILGSVCKSRQAAKRFIYALLLGAGIGKLGEVLDASTDDTRRALDRLMERYVGFQRLKDTIIPRDAKRGWFEGFDGRKVIILGDTQRDREHLCMSGYLQNGESVIMKYATIDVYPKMIGFDAKLVDLVHDEWQVEVPNGGIHEYAIPVAELYCKALERTGEKFKLKCPMKGSYWSDDYNDYTIGTNWKVTH